MSRIRRPLITDRIPSTGAQGGGQKANRFFVNVNVRRIHKDFGHSEYPLILEVINDSRRRLKFLFGGYVLMPDQGHALIWPVPPLPISYVLHDIKACPEPSEGKVSARRVHAARRTHGPFWQHQFWDRFVRKAKEYRERGLHAHEPGPERAGEKAAGLAVVELQ